LLISRNRGAGWTQSRRGMAIEQNLLICSMSRRDTHVVAARLLFRCRNLIFVLSCGATFVRHGAI
jgi:hypothetical protein